MTTSGVQTFSLDTDEIIDTAMQLLAVISPVESTSGDDYTFCLRTLNLMIKGWQSSGSYIWKETEGVLYLTSGTAKYTLGGASASRAAEKEGEASTTVSTDAVSGATNIYLTSLMGFTATEAVGVELDDGTIHWTTIASVSATYITLTLAVTDDVSAGNRVYTYTDLVGRPLDISSARRVDSDGTSWMLTPVSKKVYLNMTSRNTVTGLPTHYYVDRQRNHSKIYFYPIPDSVDSTIEYTYQRILDDFSSASDIPDFPQMWLPALVYGLAVMIAPAYGKEYKVNSAPQGGASISELAKQYLKEVSGWDQENQVRLRIRPYVSDCD